MGGFNDRARSGRPKSVPEKHYIFIDSEMVKNDKLTVMDLEQLLLDKFGRNAVNTLCALLPELGKIWGRHSLQQGIARPYERATSSRD